MKQFYEENQKFKEYVDYFCVHYKMTMEEAFNQKMVILVAKHYGYVEQVQ